MRSPRRASPATRSRSAWHRATRCPKASCSGLAWHLTRWPSAAVCRPRRTRSSTRSRVTRSSATSSGTGARSRCRTRRTASTWSSTASRPTAGIGTASRPATRTARSAAPDDADRQRAAGPAASSRSPPARITGGLLHAYADVARRLDGRSTRRLHLRGRRAGDVRAHGRRARSGRSTTTGSVMACTRRTRPPGRPRRASVDGHVGRPRGRERLRQSGIDIRTCRSEARDRREPRHTARTGSTCRSRAPASRTTRICSCTAVSTGASS